MTFPIKPKNRGASAIKAPAIIISTTYSAITVAKPISTQGSVVSWDVEYKELPSGDWITYATGLTSDSKILADLSSDKEYSIRTTSHTLVDIIGIVNARTDLMPAFLPLSDDFGIVSPGGLRQWTNVGAGGEAFFCDVMIPVSGGIETNSVEIWGVSTGGLDYVVSGIYVGDGGQLGDLTENMDTGFATVFSDGRTVIGGSDALPSFTMLASYNLQGSRTADLRFVVELAEGAEKRMWGIPLESTGWNINDVGMKLSTLPSSSWNLSGRTHSFGVLPNLLFVFRGLSRNITNVHLFGDSHIQGYGDGGITGTRGLAYRLTNDWISAGKDIIATQWGIQGRPTPDILNTYSRICETFDIRSAIYEAVSVNNYNDGFGYSDWGAQALADMNAALSVNHSQPIWPLVSGTWYLIANDPAKKTNYRATLDTLESIYASTVMSQSDGGIWDSSTLQYLEGYSFDDGAHLNSDAYDEWARLIYANLTALIES